MEKKLDPVDSILFCLLLSRRLSVYCKSLEAPWPHLVLRYIMQACPINFNCKFQDWTSTFQQLLALHLQGILLASKFEQWSQRTCTIPNLQAITSHTTLCKRKMTVNPTKSAQMTARKWETRNLCVACTQFSKTNDIALFFQSSIKYLYLSAALIACSWSSIICNLAVSCMPIVILNSLVNIVLLGWRTLSIEISQDRGESPQDMTTTWAVQEILFIGVFFNCLLGKVTQSGSGSLLDYCVRSMDVFMNHSRAWRFCLTDCKCIWQNATNRFFNILKQSMISSEFVWCYRSLILWQLCVMQVLTCSCVFFQASKNSQPDCLVG